MDFIRTISKGSRNATSLPTTPREKLARGALIKPKCVNDRFGGFPWSARRICSRMPCAVGMQAMADEIDIGANVIGGSMAMEIVESPYAST